MPHKRRKYVDTRRAGRDVVTFPTSDMPSTAHFLRVVRVPVYVRWHRVSHVNPESELERFLLRHIAQTHHHLYSNDGLHYYCRECARCVRYEYKLRLASIRE